MLFSSDYMEVKDNISGEDRMKIIGTVKQDVARILLREGVGYLYKDIKFADTKVKGKRVIYAFYER